MAHRERARRYAPMPSLRRSCAASLSPDTSSEPCRLGQGGGIGAARWACASRGLRHQFPLVPVLGRPGQPGDLFGEIDARHPLPRPAPPSR